MMRNGKSEFNRDCLILPCEVGQAVKDTVDAIFDIHVNKIGKEEMEEIIKTNVAIIDRYLYANTDLLLKSVIIIPMKETSTRNTYWFALCAINPIYHLERVRTFRNLKRKKDEAFTGYFVFNGNHLNKPNHCMNRYICFLLNLSCIYLACKEQNMLHNIQFHVDKYATGFAHMVCIGCFGDFGNLRSDVYQYKAGDSSPYDCKKSTSIEHDSSIQLVLFIYNMIMKNTFPTTASFNEIIRQKDSFYKNKFSSYLFLNEYVHLIKTLLLVSRNQLELANHHSRDHHHHKICVNHGLRAVQRSISDNERLINANERENRENIASNNRTCTFWKMEVNEILNFKSCFSFFISQYASKPSKKFTGTKNLQYILHITSDELGEFVQKCGDILHNLRAERNIQIQKLLIEESENNVATLKIGNSICQ